MEPTLFPVLLKIHFLRRGCPIELTQVFLRLLDRHSVIPSESAQTKINMVDTAIETLDNRIDASPRLFLVCNLTAFGGVVEEGVVRRGHISFSSILHSFNFQRNNAAGVRAWDFCTSWKVWRQNW